MAIDKLAMLRAKAQADMDKADNRVSAEEVALELVDFLNSTEQWRENAERLWTKIPQSQCVQRYRTAIKQNGLKGLVWPVKDVDNSVTLVRMKGEGEDGEEFVDESDENIEDGVDVFEEDES